MSAVMNYLALDLGAESGRGILGRFDGDRLDLEVIHRFPNNPVRMVDTLHWDLPCLFHEMKNAIRMTKASGVELDAAGVDTWGVDFGLIGRGDTLLGNPVHYRDSRTAGILEAAFELMPKAEIYRATGLQFMPFNTAFQLLAMKRANSPLLEIAETFLMIPDLIGWLLTGRRACERTDSSTTQLLDPATGEWSDAVCGGLGLPKAILPELIEPGTVLGSLLPSVAEEVGYAKTLPIIAPATHDTASAVVGVPSRSSKRDWCYLSSGTWSLMGVETPRPVINEKTYQYNFTNEGGYGRTTRLLKNIMGLWIVQECRRTWLRSGIDLSYDELTARAKAAKPFGSLIDPDDVSFLAPGDMPARIAAYCRKTGQHEPKDEGAVVRCALESLALKYRLVLQRLEEVAQTSIKTIHVVGGGVHNALLCQFTADACGREVQAGPVEATAIGNLLVQALARGKLGSLAELREVVARSFPVAVYEPRQTAAWNEAAERFSGLA